MINRFLLAALCCVLWAVTCYAQQQGAVRLGPLGPGLACNPLVYNPGTAPVTADCPLTPQLFYEAHTASCTINSTCGSANDSAKLLTSTGAAGAVTFTLPAPGAAGSAGYNFGYAGNSYLLASSAGIYGCGTTGTSVTLTYATSVTPDGTSWQCTPYGGGGAAASSFFPNSYLTGLLPSNDGTNPSTVIDVAAGIAADSTNTLVMKLPSSFVKLLIGPSAGFVAGSGPTAGCLDSGTTTVASTWYFLYLISNASGSTVDILCSAAALSTGPAMPTGYTLRRWIGEVITTPSNLVKAFQTIDGHIYVWTAGAGGPYQTVSVGASQTLVAILVPPGITVEPLCRISMTGTPPATVLIYNPATVDSAPDPNIPFIATPGWDQAVATLSGEVSNSACPPGLLTNTASQIAMHASAAVTVNLVNRGFRQ